MASSDRGFKGVWIDKEIWLNKDLTWMEKLFITEINSLDNDNGCFASNAHFAEFFSLSNGRCSQIINSLKKKNYLSVEYHREGKQIIKRVLRILNTGIKNIKEPIKKTKQPYLENDKGINTLYNNTVNNTDCGENTPPIDNSKQDKNNNSGNYKKIVSWFFDNNPNFSMDNKRGAIIKTIEKKCNGGGYHKFEEIANKFLKLKAEDIDGKWWGSMPTTPDVISGKWDYIISAKFKVKPKIESVEDYYS